MTSNRKATGRGFQVAQGKALNKPNYTDGIDPLQGWYDLAKPARARQMKRKWLRRTL